MKNIVYIVDDHNMVRNGLKSWLENHTEWRVPKDFASSKECLDCLECISSIRKTKANSKKNDEAGIEDFLFPEIIIVDVQLINETGFALVKTIKEKWPKIKCVMYSMFDTTGFVLQAKDSGASGYISKVAKEEELAHCLEVVQNGGTYLEQYMLDAQNKIDSIVSILSKQERNIFEALLQEKTNKQICDELYILSRTVENYTSRLYSKIGVKNREELIEKFK
ncbi:MAG: response regulator transcription factor [Treponema sp.]|nr:response regulator transcription factor [Treponema sp.]